MDNPDIAALLAAGNDTSGAWLASVINASHGGGRAAPNGNGAARPTPEGFMAQETGQASRPWDDIAGTLASSGGRNNAIMRLACSLRETTSLSQDEATEHMYQTVWPLIDQSQSGHGFPEEEFEEVIAAVWREYPGAAEHAERARAASADLAAHPLPATALELTDAYLADRVAGELSRLGFCWAPGLGWLAWNRMRWAAVDVSRVWDMIRQYFIWLHWETARSGADAALLARLSALLSKARITAAADLVRGHRLVARMAEDFDAHPDLMNTPAGICDLRTGNVRPHDAALLLTKITSGSYARGYTHRDWEQALTALDEAERRWLQLRVGQAVTGYPTPDGIMPVLQGGGENGKSSLTTEGPVKALGGYADMASHKLIASQRANATEHSTEMADLRGQRLLIGEELSEGRAIDVTALKRIQDVGRIKARYVHKDNITFDASHSLFVTSNYRPQISETDHGTWRRLALLVFPYTFRKPGQELVTGADRPGDPGLKNRIRYNLSGQHDAIVTWAVDGAVAWYAAGQVSAPVTPRIAEDTREWRKSSDHILGFWDEFLEQGRATAGEHIPCVRASHLLAVFNAWLGKNGHQPWSKETFHLRFGEHEETRNYGAEYRRTSLLDNLSRYTGSDVFTAVDPIPVQAMVWMGVRFKTVPDQGKQDRIAPVAVPQTNSPSESFTGTFIGGTATGTNVLTSTVVFDLETGTADELFTYTERDQRGFVRLAGALVDGALPMITDGHGILKTLKDAAEICGHNILAFDLLALAWHCGADYDRLAARARDTELIQRQANPPRSRESGTSLDRYGLDAVAEFYGVTGKTDDLGRLKRKFKGYDTIPLDDSEYRAYLEGDLAATAAVRELIGGYYDSDPYLRREHRLAAIAGRMTLNGFLVDQPLLETRVRETAERSRTALRKLHDVLGLPLGKAVLRGRGKAKHEEFLETDSPLSTDSGRDWLAGIWAEYGVADPPRTQKAGKLSVGADELRAVAARRPDLAGFCETVITAAWPRTVYQTASDCLCADGRVHPGVSMRQASGRWSVTNPGLTVFGKRGGRHVERDIFLPDPGHVLLSFDLSQVDMRAMAWLSQDHAYRALFAPGKDAHAEIGAQVGLDRQAAKMVGHGWNYGLSAARMKREGMDPVMVDAFISGMQQRFPDLIRWRDQIRDIGKSGQILDNGFGRRMRCDPERAFTVAPALMGQGGARDIMCECLLRLPPETYPMLRVMVHDEILLSVPKDIVLDVARDVKAAMTWQLDDDLPVLCDMASGMSWGEVSDK